MTTLRLHQIRVQAMLAGNEAERILAGDSGGYNGADGASQVSQLVGYIVELLEAIERNELGPLT